MLASRISLRICSLVMGCSVPENQFKGCLPAISGLQTMERILKLDAQNLNQKMTKVCVSE